MILYLGTHKPSWLTREGRQAPLFVSLPRLLDGPLPRRAASAPWALDSGAYSRVLADGGWTMPAIEYAWRVSGVAEQLGSLDWAAPQDWPCEAQVLARTGRTIRYHQLATTENYLELRALLEGAVNVTPVLQGWTPDDYLAHAAIYADHGVDLAAEERVGVGSVCRRGQDGAILAVLAALEPLGLRLHGFGVRGRALAASRGLLASADSLAWSYRARRAALDGDPAPCGGQHRSCTNCYAWATRWHARQKAAPARHVQHALDGGALVL